MSSFICIYQKVATFFNVKVVKSWTEQKNRTNPAALLSKYDQAYLGTCIFQVDTHWGYCKINHTLVPICDSLKRDEYVYAVITRKNDTSDMIFIRN